MKRRIGQLALFLLLEGVLFFPRCKKNKSKILEGGNLTQLSAQTICAECSSLFPSLPPSPCRQRGKPSFFVPSLMEAQPANQERGAANKRVEIKQLCKKEKKEKKGSEWVGSMLQNRNGEE